MTKLALKNLLHEPGRFLISLGGVSAALVLGLLLEGIFVGTSEQIVAYPDRTDADVWVMQKGVSNMHMATSILPVSLAEEVARVPGVEDAEPILYLNAFVRVGGEDWFSYVVGIRAGASRGGPWRMAEGKASPGLGEAVIPDVLARKGGVRLGDDITIMGRPFRVVGLSRDTFSMANSITFVSYQDLEALMGTPASASYILVKGASGVAPEVLAERIRHNVEKQRFVYGETEVRPTVSLGVACLEPDESGTSLLQRADAALYEAKQAGRNRVVKAG